MNIEDEDLLRMAETLNCKVESIPFKYLGVPVGANPRRTSTWKPVLENISMRLSSWKSRSLSLGGRIVLINSVLSSIPVYFFSIYKAPVSVIKAISELQKQFLWGGSVDRKRIHWVRWEEVCKKEDGGLGIKDLGCFNRSLLAKWRWRMISGEKGLWKSVLLSRYGDGVVSLSRTQVDLRPGKVSAWWRYLNGIVESVKGWESWFVKGVNRVIGDGRGTLFWVDKWIGDLALKDRFPRLYQLVVGKYDSVADVVNSDSGIRRCNFRWRRVLFEWEKELKGELYGCLSEVQITNGKEDEWQWTCVSNGAFTSSSAYEILCSSQTSYDDVFRNFWCKNPPLKVVAFAWKVLRRRIPTKDQLARRINGGQNLNLSCCLCNIEPESVDHLFFRCSFLHKV